MQQAIDPKKNGKHRQETNEIQAKSELELKLENQKPELFSLHGFHLGRALLFFSPCSFDRLPLLSTVYLEQTFSSGSTLILLMEFLKVQILNPRRTKPD